MSKMTKTAALRAAQDFVSKPAGYRGEWRVYATFSMTDLHGPSQEIKRNSYAEVLRIRANYVASVALALMGVAETDFCCVDYVEQIQGPMSAARFINAVLKMNPEDHNTRPNDDDSWIDTL
jgi:hypothetical protein